MSDVLDRADRNMRSAWQAVTAVGPRPVAVDRDGVVLLSSGLPIPLFNPAFVTARPDDARGVVASIVEHYAGLAVPFVVYFRDEHAGEMADACAAAGLVEHFRPPLMVLDPIVAAPDPPDGVEVVVVDRGSHGSYCDVLARGFGMPREALEAALPAGILDLDGWTSLLAEIDGEPVATSGAFVRDGVAGVYTVATVPEHRGRGVGAAVTWAAVEVGREASATMSVLQSSELGAPVYQRMGFVTLDRYRQFESASGDGGDHQ